MAKTAAQRKAARAEYERNFKATHGVSTGTYYRMRRQAAARGITGKQFDQLQAGGGYKTAKQVTQTAATNPRLAKLIVRAASLGVSPGTMRQVYAESGMAGAAMVAGSSDTTEARFQALVQASPAVYGDLSLADFDDSMDYPLGDEYDWWYHG